MFAAHYTASFFVSKISRMTPSVIPHQNFEGLTLHGIQQHKRKKKTTYSEYMYKALKQVPQGTSKHCWALDALRSLNKPHLYGMVAQEASKMSHYKKKPFITSREVHAAVRVVLLVEAVKSGLLTANDMSSRHVDST
nr:histone H2B-like [Anolis sagrei ordinatus]